MKDILFVIPSLGGGGAERVLVTLLNNLNRNKYQITLFSLFDGGSNRKYLNKNIKYKYHWKRTFRGNKHLLKLFSAEYLYNKIITKKYDVVVSYLQSPTTRIVGGCPYPETKLINWVHNEGKNEKSFTSSYRNYKEMLDIYSKYEKTIFVSETVKKSFENKFPEINSNMEVLYNTVDDSKIRALSEEKVKSIIYDNNKINLVSVGRFTEQKGYLRLIRIISKLVRKNYKNIHLYLLGTGELEEKYKELIKEYNLSDNITLLGYKDNPYKYIGNADLFVCSSYREGFSTAVTESLIVGTPVITTLCSGMEEMLGTNNEYGVITENSEDALLKGLENLLNNPHLIEYYEKKAIERGKKFNLSETVGEVERLLESH